MRIDRPIFLLGPPRSGTTLIYKAFCAHPDVAYLSRGYKRFPDAPWFAEALTRVGLASTGPKEGTVIWNRFRTTGNDVMGAADATPEIRDWYRRLVSRLVALRGKKRFLAKFPAHSLRAPWIDAIFPDCIFLVVTRDWRAVVSSTVVKTANHADDARPWSGLRVSGWEEMRKQMRDVASEARVFRIVHETIDADTAHLGDRVVRVAYEDFCADVGGEMRRVAAACGLPWSAGFEASLPVIRPGTNEKWRSNLDPAVIDAIRAAEGPALSRHEYASQAADA